ncbi:MAG: ThiF family adenylyltransferase [Candidatus Limnocylindria bacterium]
MDAWTLTIGQPLYERLWAHLFPGDDDEHGGVIAAGIATTPRGTRLLARELFLAEDGVDLVPGVRGYRRLTPEFGRDRIRHCRDQKLIYLAIHNHRGSDSVEFSEPDDCSHERGYPALLDISGQPVGALVLARNAVAGDIWTRDRRRRPIAETIVVGRNIRRLYPAAPPRPPKAEPTYDRQVRWFGERGQALLGRMKVVVVGAGGVGLPLVTMLARLGVGELVVIDPDRLAPTNLPRMPEARRIDALMPLRALPGGGWIADRLSTRKVRLARRAARRANPSIRFRGMAVNVVEPEAASELIDADYIFLAADGHLARMLVNAVAHQFLIPAVQLGTRIDIDGTTGLVGDIRTNVRPILPGSGCLRCNSLISGSRLQQDSLGERERERNRYVEEVPAPSVIGFNTWAASQAVTNFMLMLGELMESSAPIAYVRARPRLGIVEPVKPIASKPDCRDCGTIEKSRRARGDGAELPLPERHR